MKVQIEGFINFRKANYDPEDFHGMHFHHAEMTEFGYVTVMPHSFEVDIPDDFNLVSAQLAQIEEKEKLADAAYGALKTQIQFEKSKLLCISMDAQS